MPVKATNTRSKNSPRPAEEEKKKAPSVPSSGKSPAVAKARTQAAEGKKVPVAKSSAKVSSPRQSSVRKSGSPSPEDLHRKIAEVAYFISERRGFVGGSCESDWYEAEAYLRSLEGRRA